MKNEQALALLGAAIREKRLARGVSQEAFAHSIGMHRTQFGHIEQGRKDCRLSTLLRIAVALGVSISGLLSALDEIED